MAEAIGGYDFEFIEDIPDDLTCTLCHYALKNPVQIEDCGHTFCEDCFNRTKDHASANSLEFCCPLDRQVINIGRVFKNKADERKVLNLKVKCRYFVDECEWIGELRNALEHASKCSKNKTIIDKTSEELMQLLNRMTELESKLQANEETVKINVKKLVEKDRQIENQNKKIENQNKQMENQNKEIKDLKVQVENQSKEIINLRKCQTTMIMPNIEGAGRDSPVFHRGRGGGGSQSNPLPTSADGWTNVSTKSARQIAAATNIDVSKFKLTKKREGEMTLGPSTTLWRWKQ